MRTVLIFDADNTLWDADAVFRSAQLSLLRVLAEAGFLIDPESQIERLRKIDSELTNRMGRAEYDFGLLSLAMAYFYSHDLTVHEAVHEVLTSAEDIDPYLAYVAKEAHLAFEEGLKECPLLYSDAEAVLSRIRASRSFVTVLFSEGDPKRLERILEAHDIRKRGLFDVIKICSKSKDAFEEAKQQGLEFLPSRSNCSGSQVVLIGDSLHRDIKLGNQAGFITIYKPSPFKGDEKPLGADEHPDYTIAMLSELPAVLGDLDMAV